MNNIAPWDSLLKEYVNDQGRVDYCRWQQESVQELEQWLAAISLTDWSSLERGEAIAFLINLYNALTIQQVLQKYPITSIRPQFLGVPNWLAFLRFFNRKVYTLNGQALSLNAIEHNTLRQQFQEPRIHFALVCASIGCPLLRPEAYLADKLRVQLEADACRFINNPDKVRYESTNQTLYCNKIFKWYEADFLRVTDTITAYINHYCTDVELPRTVSVTYLPYNWNLNQRTSS